MSKLFLISCILMLPLLAIAQERQLDSSRKLISITREQMANMCDDWTYHNSRFYPNVDSSLYDFFVQIENDNQYEMKAEDTLRILSSILQAARREKGHVCLLPFLKVFDTAAFRIYNGCCFTRPDACGYPAYCIEARPSFAVFFFFQCYFVSPVRLKSGESFYWLGIKKKGTDQEYDLTESDYDNITKLYQSWLNRRFGKQRKIVRAPLHHSKYRWELHFKQAPPAGKTRYL